MHEIITLQLGQRSNYLATHFWNTQESYFTYSNDQESLVDHDIHFRPGIGADGNETFTPRTVIYDLKGGFGTLRKLNALYELQDEAHRPQGLWNGLPVVQRETAIEKSAYQQSLDEGLTPPRLTIDSVRYWSDFNRVYFHPRSIVQLNEYELGSILRPFEKWDVGEELFSSLDKEHDLLDRDLRPFVEEADQMQAIQLMTSVDDAWGGFTSRYMDRLRDEYGKTAIWTWGLEDGIGGIPRERQLQTLSNTARSMSEISSQASLFIPMSLPPYALPHYVSIDRKSPWHVSALFSTALESMTLPSRLRARNGNRQSLDGIAGALNVNGNQNIAKLQMSICLEPELQLQSNGDDRPGRLESSPQSRDPRVTSQNGSGNDLDSADEAPAVMDMDFFPSIDYNQARERRVATRIHIFGEAENFRDDQGSSGTTTEEGENGIDGRERARRRAAGLKIFQKTFIPLSFSLLDSFPHIYSLSSSSELLNTVPVRTSLSTDTSVALRIKTLRNVVTRSIGLEEREALSNSLGDIAEAYEEGWDSGSDEDDDDD